MSNIKKQLTLQQLLTEVLNEVGDLKSIEPYQYTYSSDYGGGREIYYGNFTTSDGDEVLMTVEEVTDNVNVYDREKKYLDKIPPVFKQGKELQGKDLLFYEIVYSVEETTSQYRKTNVRELFRILKTVLEFTTQVIPKIVKEHGRQVIFTINSQAKHTENFEPSPQKDALYRSIILQNLPKDFRNAEVTLFGKPNIIFQKL